MQKRHFEPLYKRKSGMLLQVDVWKKFLFQVETRFWAKIGGYLFQGNTLYIGACVRVCVYFGCVCVCMHSYYSRHRPR